MLNYTFISSYLLYFVLSCKFLTIFIFSRHSEFENVKSFKRRKACDRFFNIALGFRTTKNQFSPFFIHFWTKNVMVNMFRIAGLRFILAQREYDFIFLEPACHFFLYYRVHTMQQNDLLFFFFAQFAIHI